MLGIFRKLTTREPDRNHGRSATVTTGLTLSSEQRIKEMIRTCISENAQNLGHGTFDEEDDFELPDGEEFFSPYEEVFDPEPDSPAPNGAPAASSAPAPANNEPARPSGTNESPTPTPANPTGR